MRPSPPSATMTSALSISTLPYRAMRRVIASSASRAPDDRNAIAGEPLSGLLRARIHRPLFSRRQIKDRGAQVKLIGAVRSLGEKPRLLGALDAGANRIAAVSVEGAPAKAPCIGEFGKRAPELDSGRHIESSQPSVERDAKGVGQARLIAEIDNVQRTAGRHRFDRLSQRLAPRRNHR